VKKFSIKVDHNTLRACPFLDKLQKQLYPMSALNSAINALENRQEGLKVELVYNVLKVTLKKVDRDCNDDYLGLPRVSDHLRDICDVIRETTSFGTHTGLDPRAQIYYSRKSSVLQGSDLHDNALIAPNCLPSRGQKKQHALDLVSTEEIILRRQLADRRWEEQKRQQRKRSNNLDDRKIKNAVDFFSNKK
jgi:hypothetical protein